MSNIEERVSDNAKRIGSLESEVGNMKVDVGKMAVTVEHESEKQTERYQNIGTQTLELKELMQERLNLDVEREKSNREYRKERERQELDANLAKQKWVQSLFTPQTIVIVMVIILSALGITVADLPISSMVGVDVLPVAPKEVPLKP